MARTVRLLRILAAACFPSSTGGCDAGVYWGANCTQELLHSRPPGWLQQCSGYPFGANATSSATTLTWHEAGPGFGGKENRGGDVFLSTTLNMGCGGGYYGSQFHFNTSAMNLDWAIWDVSSKGADGVMYSTNNTHPVSPPGKPWRCSRYSGEGHGTHCGLGLADGFLWQLGTRYTLNISLLEGNSSAALFGATITNEKTAELIEVGKILTTNPGPTSTDPQGFDCARMRVGGGSFEEYYDGGNFTAVASISGPVFRGVTGLSDRPVLPRAFSNCAFQGNCTGGYGGCHNETTSYCVAPGAGGAGPRCEHGTLPTLTLSGGQGQVLAPEFVPPWYHWAAETSADGSAGPDGGVLPPSTQCVFKTKTNRLGGLIASRHWGHVKMVEYNSSTGKRLADKLACAPEKSDQVGACATMCCAHCRADPGCVEARLTGIGCALMHDDPGTPPAHHPFVPWTHANTNISGTMTIVPNRRTVNAALKADDEQSTPIMAGVPYSLLWNSPWPSTCVSPITANWTSMRITTNGPRAQDNGPMVSTIQPEHTGLVPRFVQGPECAAHQPCVPVNGGIPQRANLSAHLAVWAADIQRLLPDENGCGVAALDWEDWKPSFEANWGGTYKEYEVYINASVAKVRAQHPSWPDERVYAAAKTEFETAARALFTQTIDLARRMRPKMSWGFYGFPAACGCGKNAEHNGAHDRCDVPNQNDALSWLWPHVSGLFPSAYILSNNASSNRRYLDCLMVEAQRVASFSLRQRKNGVAAAPTPVWAYAQYLSEGTDRWLNSEDTRTEYARAAAWGAAGTIMWGSSGSARKLCNDANGGLQPFLQANAKVFASAVEDAMQCAAHRCHGQGRCVELPMPTCICYSGFAPTSNCSKPLASSGSLLPSTAAVSSLPRLPRLSISSVSVGGLSAGADVAIQLHVSWSDIIGGVAAFDGEPWHCDVTHFRGEPMVPADGSSRRCYNCPAGLTTVRAHCKHNASRTNVSLLQQYAAQQATVGDVADPANLARSRIYLYHGALANNYLPPCLHNSYKFYRGFMSAAAANHQILEEYSVQSGHCIPTATNYSDRSNHCPWCSKCNGGGGIQSCGYDGPAASLAHLLASAKLQPRVPRIKSNLLTFNQSVYCPSGVSHNMAENASIYVPSGCQPNSGAANSSRDGCHLHVFLVGCDGEGFFSPLVTHDHAQYQQIAEANDIVLLFPKPIKNASSPLQSAQKACFDSWGDSGAEYANRRGTQIAVMRKMIEAVAGV